MKSKKSILVEYWNIFFPVYCNKILESFKQKNKESFSEEILDNLSIKQLYNNYKDKEIKNIVEKNEEKNDGLIEKEENDDNNMSILTEEEEKEDEDIFNKIQKFTSFNKSNNDNNFGEENNNSKQLLIDNYRDIENNYKQKFYFPHNNIKTVKSIPFSNYEKTVYNNSKINNYYDSYNYPQILEKNPNPIYPEYDTRFFNNNINNTEYLPPNNIYNKNPYLYKQHFFANNEENNYPNFPHSSLYPLKCVQPYMSTTPTAPPNFVDSKNIYFNQSFIYNSVYENNCNNICHPLLKYPSGNNNKYINNNYSLLSKKSPYIENNYILNNNSSPSPDLKRNKKKKIYIKNNKLVYVINEDHTNIRDAINLDEDCENNRLKISDDDKINIIQQKLAEERKPRSSKFRGVSKNGKQWQVLIMIKQKKRYIGNFNNEIEAAREYDKIAIQFHGLKAKTNFEYTEDEINSIIASPKLEKLASLY